MDVLNRTTKELRTSQNEPEYHESEWIHGPDLSAVAGHDPRYWVITGDSVTLATGNELAAIEAEVLAEAKAAKMAAIDAKSGQILTRGIEIEPGIWLSTTLAASQNLQDIWIGYQSSMPVFPVSISTLSGGAYTVANITAFAAIMSAFGAHKRGTLEAGQALRAQVLACTTLAQVEAIVDERT